MVAKLRKLWAPLFWLCVWQAGAMALNQKILLVSPLAVAQRLLTLLPTASFWGAVWFSFTRIICGFLLACVVGTVLGALSTHFRVVAELSSPLMGAVKSTPVASFIILVLLWVPSKNLSVVISFLMVTPLLYANVRAGIAALDSQLHEMAVVFRVPFRRQLRYLYIPQLMPFFRSACATGLGLCWKAGVAAEVIGLPSGSIGEKLYQAKVYLETPDLFAWTVVIVVISFCFERLFLASLDRFLHHITRT